MKNKPLNDLQRHYYNFLKNENDSNVYFFINNVCESLNRTINSFSKYSRKNFLYFELCIKKIIEHYENHWIIMKKIYLFHVFYHGIVEAIIFQV